MDILILLPMRLNLAGHISQLPILELIHALHDETRDEGQGIGLSRQGIPKRKEV